MQTGKALERLDKLSLAEAKALCSNLTHQIADYERSSKNYLPEKYEKFAAPYLAKLCGSKVRVLKRIEDLSQHNQ